MGALPKLWPHIVLALLLIAGVAGAGVAAALFSDPSAAHPVREVALPERALPPPSDTLMADGGTLPDLLAGTVEPGANPTDALVGGNVGGSDLPPPPPTLEPAATAPSRDALRPAPIPELHTQSTFGRIPMTAPDGTSAFRAYARPHARGTKPTVSIVLGGLGIDRATTRRAIEDLPPEVTLAFAAHAPNLQDDIDAARAFGHEVILELPMEGTGYNLTEPGADRMLRTGDETQALRNLDFLLSRAAGYFAVTPYNGNIFLARTDASAPILARLETSGLGFLSDPQLDVPTLEAASKAVGLPFRRGTMLIDATPEPELIARDLEDLRARTLAGERPIGFGFAYPQTLDALTEWLPTLERADLAPASAAMR